MESTLVSARIPTAKKEASAGILRQIGATATDLINSAYDYLLESGELPHVGKDAPQRRDFDAFVAASTLAVDWGDAADGTAGIADAGDYKRMIADWRRAEYESLA